MWIVGSDEHCLKCPCQALWEHGVGMMVRVEGRCREGDMRVKVNFFKWVGLLYGLSWWLSDKESPQRMLETWVQPLGWEDPLEKGIATHSSILAWRIPWTEEPGGLQYIGSQKSQTRWATFTSLGLLYIKLVNTNPCVAKGSILSIL